MVLVDNPNLAGNILGLLALVWKTAYDLLWNPRRFKKELATLDPLEATRRKRDRADLTTAITFAALAASYALFILGSIQ